MIEELTCKDCWWLAPERNLNCCAQYYRLIDEDGKVIVDPSQPACWLFVPPGTLKAERARLWIEVEKMKEAVREALHPLPMRAILILARILNFFKRIDNHKG